MATTLANPAASATAAAPAAATAPTSTTPSTPSAPSTPAASTPVQDGHQGAGALNSADSINAMVEAAKAKGFNEDGTRTDPTKPATDTPAAPSAETKPDASASPETKPAAETPATTTTDENPYTFERDGFVGAKDLAAQIDANPALAKHLTPELRNVIMANSRLAERASQYEKFFASPAEAEIVTQAAQEHAGFSEAFSLIASDVEKGTTAFINKLIEASVLRDDEGNPLKYDNGTLKTNGTANQFVETIGKRWMKLNIEKKVKAIADAETRENVEAALDLVMESVGLRPSTADKTTNQDPALAAREAELKRQQDALNAERESDRKQKTETFNKSRQSALEKVYDDEVGNVLKLATGVDKLRRKAIESELEGAIRQRIKTNVAYQRRLSNIQSRPMSEARIKQEASLAREFLRDNLVTIAGPIFADAGIAINQASQERASAQAAREANSRSEVNGGRPATAQPTRTGNTAADLAAAAAADWKKANPGKEPSETDIRLHQMVMAARAKGFAA